MKDERLAQIAWMAVLVQKIGGVGDADESRDGIKEVREEDRDDRRDQSEFQSAENIQLKKDAFEIRQAQGLRWGRHQTKRPGDYGNDDDCEEERERIFPGHQKDRDRQSENR